MFVTISAYLEVGVKCSILSCVIRLMPLQTRKHCCGRLVALIVARLCALETFVAETQIFSREHSVSTRNVACTRKLGIMFP